MCVCADSNNSFKIWIASRQAKFFFACWQVTFDFQIFDLLAMAGSSTCERGRLQGPPASSPWTHPERRGLPGRGRTTLEGRLANLTSCLSYPPVWAGCFHVNGFRCGTFILTCRPMTCFAYSGTLAGKVSASGEEQVSRVGSFSSLNNPVRLLCRSFCSLFMSPLSRG